MRRLRPPLLRLRLGLPLLALVLLPRTAGGQQPRPQEPPSFTFEERVSALDVMIELDRSALAEWLRSRPATAKLAVEDVTVLYGGQSQTVIEVEPPERGDRAVLDWNLVLYFDLALSTDRNVRWSASRLAEQAAELTRLGNVELVIADPEPTVIYAGRDASHLENSLSNLALTGEGDDELVGLRLELASLLEELEAELDEDPEAEPELAPEELATLFALEERRLVQRQQDALVTFLHARSALSAERALFLVSDGYDPSPERFYLPRAGQDVPRETGSLVDDTDDTARTLAAYGWSVFALRAPPLDVAKQKKGFRIGKLRFRPALGIIGIAATYEEDRKPDLADALVGLGDAHAEAGQLADAEGAYRKALFHYYGDPRTADRQAKALNKLGAVLERDAREREAEAVYEAAAQLAPEQSSPRLEVLDTDLLDPMAPLLVLAETTAGGVVLEEGALPAMLEDLSQRVRVTYQVSGRPDGLLRPFEVTLSGSRARLRYPGWARFSTPERVATARVRRTMEGESSSEGDLPLTARLDDDGRVLSLALVAEPGDPSAATARVLRVSWATEVVDAPLEVEHRIVQTEASRETWTHSLVLPEEPSRLVVAVEDLTTGLFGLAEVEP